MVAVAPLVMAVGLALAALTPADALRSALVAVWAVALVITGDGHRHGVAAPVGMGDGLRR